ncbi:MAG: hypothetical protein ACR2L0_04770 [Gaiellaceae bacterium]
MERTLRSTERRDYATAVADLWDSLGDALGHLERIAEAPPHLVGADVLDELPPLQYTLHTASELALGIEPPRGAEAVHEELVGSLAHARDATAQVAAGLSDGDDELVECSLPEWRGALFRIRLARLRALERLAAPVRSEAPAALTEPPGGSRVAALAATALVVVGALLFTSGAVLAAWPVWAAGLALFAGGFVLFRP